MKIAYTKSLFLRAYSAIYLFAFLSLYTQIAGLYGNNGIFPVRIQLENIKGVSLSDKIQNKPTLLWLAPYLGLDAEYMMDVLSLIGAIFSFSGFVSQKFCTAPFFLGLWSLYFSLFQVGQIFMKFQWDSLLLEGGFLCIFLAPLLPAKSRLQRKISSAHVDTLIFFLLRWLLFRLMFSTSANKLLSGCPHWWGLDALKIHFQSMPLPTAFSWYAYHLPNWFLRVTTLYTIVLEHIGPILFLVPVRSVKITAFFNQLFLQICSILTGNFNFYNYLAITLILTLVDDEFFGVARADNRRNIFKYQGHVINALIHGVVLYGVFRVVDITSPFDVNFNFTKVQYENVLTKIMIPSIIIFGALCLLGTILKMRFRVTLFTLTLTTIYCLSATSLFAITTVPLTSIHSATNSTMPQNVYKYFKLAQTYRLANVHGFWKKMVGENGRLEVVLESSDNIDGPWLDVDGYYKPGNVNSTPPLVAPHSPRLDWQMWHASQGTYQKHLWMITLAYRLLTGQPEVVKLFRVPHQKFIQSPPKYLRASLYKYEYTRWNQRNSNSWWTRERVGEYFPIFSKNDATLIAYLKSLKVWPPKVGPGNVNSLFKSLLDYLRAALGYVEGGVLLWSVFGAGCAIIATRTPTIIVKRTA